MSGRVCVYMCKCGFVQVHVSERVWVHDVFVCVV